MGTFGTFLLAVAAFVGTILLLVSPMAKLTNWMRGKKKSQIEREIKEWIEAQEVGSLIGKGCGFVIFLLASIAFTFMVEPLAVIAALVNKIGYQPLAYVMLAVVALSWVEAVRGFRSSSHKNKRIVKPVRVGIVIKPDGERVEGTVEDDEEIKLPHPFWTAARRAFFALPTIYLWYLFLVVIGILP